MPTYTYACKQCDDRFDVVLSFTDDPMTVCPACEGELRQVFKPAGIVFKGSGWHIKDYADGGSGGGGGSSSSTGSSSSSDGGSSSSDSSGSSGSSSSDSSGSSGSSGGETAKASSSTSSSDD